MITIQGLMPDGKTWGTVNAFVTENKLVKAGSMDKRELLARAERMRGNWYICYSHEMELRVHDSDGRVRKSAPATCGSHNYGESDPMVTQDNAGADTAISMVMIDPWSIQKAES